MPLERREVVLIGDELTDAVRAHAHADPGMLPSGVIVGVAVNTDDEPIAVTIKLTGTRPDAEGACIYLQKEQCLPILIRFCTEHNIPVPRAGRKSVKILPLPLKSGTTRCLCLSIVLRPDAAA